MRAIALIAALTLASAALGQAPARVFRGPSRYCGTSFAVDLARDDRVEVQRGPDFLLEALVSPRGGFGLYEGFAPQDGTGDQRVEAGLGRPTYRITRHGDAFGYVIWTGTAAAPFFVHVWGQAFKGTAAEFALLRRLQVGAAAKRGCPGPTLAR